MMNESSLSEMRLKESIVLVHILDEKDKQAHISGILSEVDAQFQTPARKQSIEKPKSKELVGVGMDLVGHRPVDTIWELSGLAAVFVRFDRRWPSEHVNSRILMVLRESAPTRLVVTSSQARQHQIKKGAEVAVGLKKAIMTLKMSFPIIDVSGINDPESQPHIAQEITEACQRWGFLLLKGHSIPPSDIEEMFELAKDFFTLPEIEKSGYPITNKSIGYVGSFQDRGKDDKMSMWFGGIPGTLDKNLDMLPPFWREYTNKIDTFKHKCHDLITKLLECFALALELPDRNFFAKAHREDIGNGNSLRMLMYPARSEMPAIKDMGSRMIPHTDSGSVTLLFQRAAGLEVESPTGDGWVKAPHIENCILINLGDALSFWSGTQLKATLHRVTFDSLPHDQERQTMAYFGAANPSTVLQPIISGRNAEKYYSNGVELKPGITVGELSQMIMRNIYGSAFNTQEKIHKPDRMHSATAV